MSSIQDREKYLKKTLLDPANILGEIYMITNLMTEKVYIGQTRTHYRDGNKYTPAGYNHRFDNHKQEARSCKGNQCQYLNNAIRKYGEDMFTVELVVRCELSDLDRLEIYYIDQFDSLCPNGYNLTPGGQGAVQVVYGLVDADGNITPQKKKRPLGIKWSEETKRKMSIISKAVCNTPAYKTRHSSISKTRYETARRKKFEGVKVDHSLLNLYMTNPCRDAKGSHQVNVTVDGIRTSFASRTETAAQVKQRAIDFLMSLPPK